MLLFPISLTLLQVGLFGFAIAVVFFLILTVGFILEIGSGAINISHKISEATPPAPLQERVA